MTKLWDVYIGVLVEAETEEEAREIMSAGLEGTEHEIHSCEEIVEIGEDVTPSDRELIELELDQAEELRENLNEGLI